MPSKRKMASVSVTGEFGRRLFAYAKEHGVSASQIVERALAPVLSGPMRPAPAKRGTTAETGPSLRPAVLASGLSLRVGLPCSYELLEDLDARIERGAQVDGRPATREDLLELGINRMLDLLETMPPGRTCAICAGEVVGGVRLAPLGRNDALVWICYSCDTEHPRRGRYRFDGGRSTDGRESRGVLISGNDANGNRRKGPRYE